MRKFENLLVSQVAKNALKLSIYEKIKKNKDALLRQFQVFPGILLKFNFLPCFPCFPSRMNTLWMHGLLRVGHDGCTKLHLGKKLGWSREYRLVIWPNTFNIFVVLAGLKKTIVCSYAILFVSYV